MVEAPPRFQKFRLGEKGGFMSIPRRRCALPTCEGFVKSCFLRWDWSFLRVFGRF